MPTIGVTASDERSARRYVEAMREHGVDTVLLLPGQGASAEEALQHLHGVLLSGGPDIDPLAYQATPDPGAHLQVDSARDAFELPLLRLALALDLPVLGLCRGMQAINVVCGGSLIQDLPNHRADDGSGTRFHHIWIAPGSKLAAAIGAGGLVRVNSIHHQGLREPQKAPSLLASAYAPEDSLIEALESVEHRWVLGVQCHPERKDARDRSEVPPQFRGLFATLAQKAAERSKASG